jgi:hypothetical protein
VEKKKQLLRNIRARSQNGQVTKLVVVYPRISAALHVRPWSLELFFWWPYWL